MPKSLKSAAKAKENDLFGGPRAKGRPRRTSRSPRAAAAPRPAIPRATSRCWRVWSRCAAGPACISAAPTRRRCIICSPKSSTTPWTRRWRAMPTFIEVELTADGFLDRHRQRPRHPGRSASEIPEEVGARSHHVHAAFGRQIRLQGLRDLGRPARRRRLRGERAVLAARGRGRAQPETLSHEL